MTPARGVPARGEVWLHERPDRKARPVVVLTRDEAIGGLNKILVAPTTGTVRGLRTEVHVGPEDGLRQAGVLNLDNTFLAHKRYLTRRIAERVGPHKMHEVCTALDKATGCD